VFHPGEVFMQHDHVGGGAAAGASSSSIGDFLARLFDTDFMARGECVSWRPEILWLHVISDATIALAYYSIPIALIYYVRRRRDQAAFNWMYVMFAMFILACGTTHLMSIVAFWRPYYRLDGVIKLITGVLSIATAATLWPLIPKALALPKPSDLEAANRELSREIEERKRIESELRAARGQLEQRVDERTAELVHANEQLRSEIFERQRAESTLTQSEERFRVALGTAPISVFNQDRALRYTWFDGPRTGMHGREVTGRTDQEVFAPETALRLTEIKRRVLATGVGEHSELPVRTDGEVRHVDFRVEPLRTPAGDIVGITGVKVDITERKLAEQHKAFLLAELDHRVKNNLSVVLALAEESLRNSRSMADFSRAFIGRVRALAKTHAALAASRWEGVRLNDLIALTLESYVLGGPAGGPGRASVSGPPIQLSPKAASALCMTVNELVTNAAKYGAFSAPGGRVDIRWEIVEPTSPASGERSLRLVWEETGGPPVTPPEHRGLGTQLIEDGVAYEMGGLVRMEFRPQGVRCTVIFALNEENTRRGRFEREVAPPDPAVPSSTSPPSSAAAGPGGSR
jgi:PAS domain S-box-containing protein